MVRDAVTKRRHDDIHDIKYLQKLYKFIHNGWDRLVGGN